MNTQVFGPVPSRRLGRSLGVDLVPFKTCTYDCVYCQLGRTTRKTVARREWVALEGVLAKLQERLSSNPDYITLSGSGEPTLYSRLDELIARIKAMTEIPVAVLTNGSLLWQPTVRRQLASADLVIPSLDAGREMTFRAVNRPHDSITFATMLQGLIDFRQEYSGQVWLEVLVLGGINAMDDEITRLADCVRQVRPDRVQLNTVTRPPAERFAVSVPAARLAEIAVAFTPRAEVIADFRGVHQQPRFAAGRQDVLNLLSRRPCTIEDIAGGLGMHRNEVLKYVGELDAEHQLQESRVHGARYYAVAQHAPE